MCEIANLSNLHTGIDYVTLGGVRQYENYNNGLDENDSRGIWQKVLRIKSVFYKKIPTKSNSLNLISI